MPEILDEIDKRLSRRCSECPGSTLAELIAPLLEEISRTIYDRLGKLEVRGLIDVDWTAPRGRALAKITGNGKAVIEGRDDLPSTEVRSP